jgi:hypothetical protein
VRLALLTTATLPLATAAPAHAKSETGSVAGRLTGALPTNGLGKASVRAYDVETGALTNVAAISSSGRFSVRLPAGGYLLHAVSVRDGAALSERLVPVSLNAGQRRSGLRIRLARVRAAPTAAAVPTPPITPTTASAPTAANARLTYRFDDFAGDTGARATLGRGLPALVAADIAGRESCDATQMVGARELRTLRSPRLLRRSSSFSSKLVLDRDLVAPRVVVRGRLSASPSSAHAAFTIDVVEVSTGRVLDTLQGAVRRRGRGLFTDERRIAAALTERLCRRPRAYRVGVALTLRGEYTAYNSTAAMNSTLRAKTTSEAPYAKWAGGQSFTYTDNVFRSRVSGCPATTITPGRGSWGAAVTVASGEQARVDLDLTITEATAYSTGNFNCEKDLLVVKNAPGPLLLGLKPRTFTLPLTGGTATIDSTLTLPTGGFIQRGTLTLTPVWSHALPHA